ncbi:hypothetical protein M9H77_25751 [Catharanthus roseus]|uniref:Uncharacterized protein n=1 Tax=Catharanthus roseus TaxID=4058 RepID=A0ACC0AAD4_CATRO|nr:hypothetical protein M9H77_25751 [Catharanthus roseus]
MEKRERERSVSPRAIGTKFRHLVVNTSQTPYECSITNNRTPISLVKTGYRLLGHQPGLPWGQPPFRDLSARSTSRLLWLHKKFVVCRFFGNIYISKNVLA